MYHGFLVVWDLYPRAAVCLPEGTNPILHSAGDLCHSAFIDPANCFTIFTRSHSFAHGAFQVPTTMVQVLVVVEDLFACRCKVCGVECDHAVALIDDAGIIVECGPVICGVC